MGVKINEITVVGQVEIRVLGGRGERRQADRKKG